MIAAVHVGAVSSARFPGQMGTLVVPRWLADELGIVGSSSLH
jgi:hypothetical protein